MFLLRILSLSRLEFDSLLNVLLLLRLTIWAGNILRRGRIRWLLLWRVTGSSKLLLAVGRGGKRLSWRHIRHRPRLVLNITRCRRSADSRDRASRLFLFLAYRVRCCDFWFFLGLHDGNLIGQWLLSFAFDGVPLGQHDFNFNSQHSLTQLDMTNGGTHKLVHGMPAMYHQAIMKLHRLCSLIPQLP